MRVRAPHYLWLAGAIVALTASAAPAWAQFEEPDTVPRFDAGVFVDLDFRGNRGVTGSTDVKFTNGPVGGLRFDYRLTGTLTIGAFAGYTRAQEKLTTASGETVIGEAHFNILQFGGELLIRVKPRIPGYFILGGGAQMVNPQSDGAPQLTGTETFTEPFGIVGAGFEFASTRRRGFRLNFKLNLVNPTDQANYDPKSTEVDFLLGAAFILRF